MSFHNSSHDIRIEFADRSTFLVAMVKDAHGHPHPNRIRLDKHIGNSDGWFIWGGENFTATARDIRLDQGPRGPKLTAELPMRNGGFRERQGIDLADKIENQNGHLVFLVRALLEV
ncbi:hypothetical protein ASPZODRAFT_146357 [Penicilliopsis zonata CBS 506.65]|uniref:Cyanovirin-N domain-containing protein n=1 Tax=Penicilliopsis zonata CBS 506.65 TaxID=1073090 RepID=A0A1L9S792_9EURO|nr:hypothetical protein ASPZODRAFT_146357 [Penicilliopsis zonata CBS 506.65]OJJ43047.1 hypothetical protein ASPZODRAFT_146357 [Penicilliopsis zonata CBS 506.65]